MFAYLTNPIIIIKRRSYSLSSQQPKWAKATVQVPAVSGFPTAQQNPHAIKTREASTHLHVFPQLDSLNITAKSCCEYLFTNLQGSQALRGHKNIVHKGISCPWIYPPETSTAFQKLTNQQVLLYPR